MLINRKSLDSIYKKEISISLAEKKEDLVFFATHNYYIKKGLENHSIFLNLAKVQNENFILNSNTEFLMNVEFQGQSFEEIQPILKNYIKTIENIINKDMTQSIEEKIDIINNELKKVDGINFSINSSYLPKKTTPSEGFDNKSNNSTNQSNSSNKSGESFKDKLNRVPTVYIFEKLMELGLIDVVKGPENNGDENFYWINLPNVAKPSKISMLSKKSIQSGIVKKHGVCRDMNNGIINSGTTQGFLYALQENDVFGDMEVFDVTQRIMKECNGFKELPLVDKKNDKIQMGEGGEYIDIVSISKPSRLPEIYRAKKPLEEYKKYLVEERGISEDIIERDIEKRVIHTGTFATSGNYNNFNLGFFQLSYLNKEGARKYSKTYEKFSFDTNGKLDRGHLKNIKIKGRSHIIPAENKVKSTVFTEAVIDNYSIEELFRMSNKVNEKDYNFVGLTSVGNIQGWLEYNLNVKLMFKEDKEDPEKLNVYFIRRKAEKLEGEQKEKAKQKIAKGLKKLNIHFIHNQKNDKIKEKNAKAFYKLKKVLAEIDPEIVVNEEFLKDFKDRVDYKEYQKGDDSPDFMIDCTNINEFLEENNITTSYDQDESGKRKFKTHIIERKEELLPITPDSKELIEAIRNRYIELTGSDSMTFAFDNDTAALPKVVYLQKLCKLLNLESNIMIPTFQYKINDNNDVLRVYKDLQANSRKDEASKLLDGFINQLSINKNKLPVEFNKIMEYSKKIDEQKKKEKASKKKKMSP